MKIGNNSRGWVEEKIRCREGGTSPNNNVDRK